MTEIWKDVPGYEGRYQVSDWGNVRSLNYKGTGKIQNLKPRFIEKYLVVTLRTGIKKKYYRIHQLVAMAFLGHIPNGMNKIVDHKKEGNPTDNRLENLQITTNRINIIKAIVRDLPTGVYFHKPTKKYLASIYINRKQIHLGYFLTPEEASQAYQNKLKEIIE